MNKFKVLLLYPNGKLMNPPPISMGIFTALLRENDFEVGLFDTTLYPDPHSIGSDEAKAKNLQVRPFNYGSREVRLKDTDMVADLVEKVKDFRPDLIAISILECTYSRSLSMLNVIENFDIPVIAGGVFPTFAPEIVFSSKNISMICIGEGEESLLEVCRRMATGMDYSDVENLCFKKGREIIQNRLRRPVDIDNLPIPDYSLFEPERFFRPMAGKVYKTIPIETNRGCPYACSFCNSPSMFKLYRENNFNFFRRKKLPKIKEELDCLIKKWDAEYIYFSSDNFLVGTDAEFNEFIEIYKEIRLPFWMQSRPEKITEYRARRLKEVGCHRMSIGLEHGNYNFRKNALKKNFSNQAVIKASGILADAGIPLTVNNIIGFCDETRELIFDTIKLNRKLTVDSTNCAIFAPFHGTPMQRLCVEKGYVSDDTVFGSINVDAPLDMPQLSKEEIRGLQRTLALYARMPKEYWPKIKRAEKFDEEGDRIFMQLRKIYQDRYFS